MKNIQKNNALIAEFMGHLYNGKIDPKNYYVITPHGKYFLLNSKYHSSWDWLMTVVEKIEKTAITQLTYDDCDGCTKPHYFEIINKAGGEIFSEFSNNKIMLIYTGCIEFIKWYNKQNKV